MQDCISAMVYCGQGDSLRLNMNIKYNLLLLIFTFSMNAISDISNNPSSWYVVTDQVMGGKSELEAGYDDGVF